MASKFIKKALRRHGSRKITAIDRLCSYRAAMRELRNTEKHEVGRSAKIRAENSHQPSRRREKTMLRFRKMNTLQKFASVHASLHKHLNQDRHLTSWEIYKANRSAALA